MGKLYTRNYDEAVSFMPADWQYRSRHNPYTFPTSKWGYKGAAFMHHVFQAGSILDYGCGYSPGLDSLEGKCAIERYDPFIPEYEAYPTRRHDMVICYNVLNVVEDFFLDAVMFEVMSFARKVALFSIMIPGLYYRKAAAYTDLFGSYFEILDMNLTHRPDEPEHKKTWLYLAVKP